MAKTVKETVGTQPHGLRTHLLKAFFYVWSGDPNGVSVAELAKVTGLAPKTVLGEASSRYPIVRLRNQRQTVVISHEVQPSDFTGSGLRVSPKPNAGCKIANVGVKGRMIK